MDLIRTIIKVAGLALLASGCAVSDFPDMDSMFDSNEVLHVKSVNCPEEADRNAFLIKLNIDSDAISLSDMDGVSSFARVFPAGTSKEDKLRKHGLDRWYKVNLKKEATLNEVAERFAESSMVQSIQYMVKAQKASDCISYPHYPTSSPVTKANPDLTFNDPSLIHQWHYKNDGSAGVSVSAVAGADINVMEAWKLTAGDPSIIVAVLDEGVCYDHPDLAANIWTNTNETINGIDDDKNGYIDDIHGYNFADNGKVSWEDPEDSGHGTHVAGTVAAVNNNSLGVCGVAGGTGKNDGVRIMSCQVFSGNRGGEPDITAKGIVYAADNGASILQASLGYRAPSFTNDAMFREHCGIEVDALEYFIDTKNNDIVDGGICIFAAGNESQPLSGYPAGYSKMISVTSLASDHRPAYYTNYGQGCNIASIGGEYYTGGANRYEAGILSTLPYNVSESGYGYMQGTSMACPHASGIAALGLSYMKKLGKTCTVEEFKSMFLTAINEMESYFIGEKFTLVGTDMGSMKLVPYVNKMGTGLTDTWKLLMKIEGTPCLTAEIGRNQWLDLSSYFGGAYEDITYLDVEVDDKTRTNLGLAQEPYIQYGKLYIHPTKVGSGKFKISIVAGGSSLGTDTEMGGMVATQTISVISKTKKSSNGGWM